jgi:hypothetical protein
LIDFLAMLWPAVVLAALMCAMARRSDRVYFGVSAALVFALTLFALIEPTVTMRYVGPKWATGYHSWAFPLAALMLCVVLSIWRGIRRPGFRAYFTCVAIAWVTMFPGTWMA